VDSLKVFVSQLFVGLPAIALRPIDFHQIENYLYVPVLVFICMFIILRYLIRNLSKIAILNDTENSIYEKESRIYLYLISFCLVASPGMIMSLQPTWWNRASLTHSYLGVMICEFGTALLIALILGRKLENISTRFRTDSKNEKFVRGKKKVINKYSQKLLLNSSIIRINQGVLLVCILLFLNASHNILVAEENKGRNFQYDAWDALTAQKSIFEGVKSRDIFISNNQDDAYETNAGKFYYNSGIRLSYLFKTNIIYPEKISCISESECDLLPVKEIATQRLGNLVRSGAGTKTWGDFNNESVDWIESNRAPGVLNNSKVWAFDMFPISQSTYISYLAPFIENRKIPTLDFSKIRFFTVENSTKPLLSPSANGFCFNLKTQYLSNNGLVVKVWELPKLDDNINTKFRKELPFSAIEVGLCAQG
jgi:hypothetical protein